MVGGGKSCPDWEGVVMKGTEHSPAPYEVRRTTSTEYVAVSVRKTTQFVLPSVFDIHIQHNNTNQATVRSRKRSRYQHMANKARRVVLCGGREPQSHSHRPKAIESLSPPGHRACQVLTTVLRIPKTHTCGVQYSVPSSLSPPRLSDLTTRQFGNWSRLPTGH